jgi:hypothetical protein
VTWIADVIQLQQVRVVVTISTTQDHRFVTNPVRANPE